MQNRRAKRTSKTGEQKKGKQKSEKALRNFGPNLPPAALLERKTKEQKLSGKQEIMIALGDRSGHLSLFRFSLLKRPTTKGSLRKADYEKEECERPRKISNFLDPERIQEPQES